MHCSIHVSPDVISPDSYHKISPVSIPKGRLEEADGLAHRCLDVQRFDVLPILLEERDEEVDALGGRIVSHGSFEEERMGVLTQHDVSENLVVIHLDVANGDAQAQDLLELELDGGTDLGDLIAQVLGVGDGGGEFASYERGGLLGRYVGCNAGRTL